MTDGSDVPNCKGNCRSGEVVSGGVSVSLVLSWKCGSLYSLLLVIVPYCYDGR
jgi:hypothetical protein